MNEKLIREICMMNVKGEISDREAMLVISVITFTQKGAQKKCKEWAIKAISCIKEERKR